MVQEFQKVENLLEELFKWKTGSDTGRSSNGYNSWKNRKICISLIGSIERRFKRADRTLKKLVLDVAAHINVVLDYPEEGIDDPLPENLVGNLREVMDTTDILIRSYDKGK